MGSRGSVIPFFLKKREESQLPITSTEMTRFNITLEAGVDVVLFALENHLGGEIFIPKIPSYRILDVAEAIAPNCKQIIIGLRPGEKIHEEMITDTDAMNTIDLGKYYAILPVVSNFFSKSDFINHYNATEVKVGFNYNSGTNSEWDDVERLRFLIEKHVDKDFKIFG